MKAKWLVKSITFLVYRGEQDCMLNKKKLSKSKKRKRQQKSWFDRRMKVQEKKKWNTYSKGCYNCLHFKSHRRSDSMSTRNLFQCDNLFSLALSHTKHKHTHAHKDTHIQFVAILLPKLSVLIGCKEIVHLGSKAFEKWQQQIKMALMRMDKCLTVVTLYISWASQHWNS